MFYSVLDIIFSVYMAHCPLVSLSSDDMAMTHSHCQYYVGETNRFSALAFTQGVHSTDIRTSSIQQSPVNSDTRGMGPYSILI